LSRERCTGVGSGWYTAGERTGVRYLHPDPARRLAKISAGIGSQSNLEFAFFVRAFNSPHPDHTETAKNELKKGNFRGLGFFFFFFSLPLVEGACFRASKLQWESMHKQGRKSRIVLCSQAPGMSANMRGRIKLAYSDVWFSHASFELFA